MLRYFSAAALFLLASCTHPPKPAPQNPSPMVEFTRAHERLQQVAIAGEQFKVEHAEILITPRAAAAGEADVLIHFHGASWVPFQAAAGRQLVVAVVNIGQGGGAYDAAFREPAALESLLAAIRARIRIRRVYLSGFSAGYGAVRAILRNGEGPSPGPSDHPLPIGEGQIPAVPLPPGEGAAKRRVRVDGILLLDGLHTSYVDDRKVDPAAMQPFLDFARDAVVGRKRFVFSHSEIFPGTFASTTETSDYLIQQLGLKRTPVVRWGPRGMQQISEVHVGGLTILGFAGNSAPDHIDQFHSMPEFLELLFEGGPP
jgi:hypothetical protein